MNAIMKRQKMPIGNMDDLAHQLALINKVLTIGFHATITNRHDEDYAFLKSIEHYDISELKEQIIEKLLNR